MRRFQDLPIRRKLTLFIMLISSLALVMAILAVAGYEVFTLKQRAVSDLATLAEMIGVSTPAALDFDDPKMAQETLAPLKAERPIISACIYKKDGSVFASYTRPGSGSVELPKPQAEGERFEGRELLLFRHILSDSEVVGTVYL